MKKIIYLIFIFGLLGLLISGYLSYEYSQPSAIGCPIGGQSCQTVRVSPYSSLFGISVPFIGIFFYLAVSTMAVLTLEKEMVKKLLFILTLGGFIFSIYLTALEAFVIHAFCFWCILSALISSLIFVLSWALLKLKSSVKITE